MTAKKTILYLQLPRLDTDTESSAENLALAALYLRCSLERSGERTYYQFLPQMLQADSLDDNHCMSSIAKIHPAVIVVTLYAWNIERSISLLRRLKDLKPETVCLAGGPEVAREHPFLWRSKVFSAAVEGEGEVVFPGILKALRTGRRLQYSNVAWRVAGEYEWGDRKPPDVEFAASLPPPAWHHMMPDTGGMGYIESGRGCSWRCAFCCYNQRRTRQGWLSARETLQRIRIMVRRGAREIRFIDPTFNSNPMFEEILKGLARMNVGRKVSFFAELRAETLTSAQCEMLTKANFEEVEVGVQSRSISVLRAICRPSDPRATERGIRLLAGSGIKTTVDIMCGLPGQSLRDITASLRWASRIRGVSVQFLHTLLLPGTELRRNRRKLKLSAGSRPPYRVRRTELLSAQDMMKAERVARRMSGTDQDFSTRRFVGFRIPELFAERIRLSTDDLHNTVIPGRENKRALIIAGEDLFSIRNAICTTIRNAILNEPHVLWQFVLSPAREEPLDLLSMAADEIDGLPRQFIDRMTFSERGDEIVSRRIFVMLRRGRRYSRRWMAASEEYLRTRFF